MALILTLGILVLVTLLVIAFAVSMRVESMASKNFNDYYKARELAKGAIDQAVGTIRQATTRSPTLLSYVTFPGVIYYNNPTVGATTRVPLYSQTAAGAINTASNPDPFDMNNALNGVYWLAGSNGEFGPPALPANAQFPVGWVYVAANGNSTAMVPNSLPLNAPLVGRFAYWVDDEASKINIDSAGTPTAPVPKPDYGYSFPNEVDLSMLLSGMGPASSIVGARAPNPFTTLEEIKRTPPGFTAAQFDANRFSMTPYSSDAIYPNYTDDLDAFGVPRRSPSGTSAVTEPIDIKDNPATNASLYVRLSDATSLGRVYGSTFATKYPPVSGVDGLKQIIANIIAYQHNPQNAADPLPYPPTDYPGSTPPTYLGLAKAPYVSEVQIQYTVANAGSGSYTITPSVNVVLYYLYGADGSTYTATPSLDKITVSGLPANLFPLGSFSVNVPANTFSSASPSQPVPFPPFPPVTVGAAGVSAGFATPVITYTRGGNLLNYAQAKFLLQPITPPSSWYQYSVVKDPALNYTSGQWTPTSANGTLPTGSHLALPADVSKLLMRAAPMQSIGEIGYIHLPLDTAGNNVWKHLTLQPGGGGGVIPDWAILDYFTVDPSVVPKPTAGRINVNSFINLGLAIAAPNTKRLVPLKALLNSVAPPPPATDIYTDSRSDKFGMKDPGTGGAIFDTIGEVCEIASLGNSGVNDFAREAAIRRIANLITVRSNTFTIWVIAQSIKQPPNATSGTFTPGIDIITGEVRAQAVVERYEVGGVPKFRVRYFRYL